MQAKRRRLPIKATETELPEFYDKTGMVLLPVDPRLVYVYWEVSQKDLRRARRKFADARAILRFQDLGGTAEAEKHAKGFFDIEVEISSRSMFVPLWSSGRTYRVELGLKGPGDRFLSLTCSNIAGTATDSMDGKSAARFVMVAGDRQIVEIPGRMGPSRSDEPMDAEGDCNETVSDLKHPSRAEEPPYPVTGFAQTEPLGEMSVQREAAMEPDRESSPDLAAWCERRFDPGVSSRKEPESGNQEPAMTARNPDCSAN